MFLLYSPSAPSHSQVKDPKAESTLDTINLTWVKPEDKVNGYRITCTPADAIDSEVRVDAEVTSAKFEALVAGREYQLDIYAVYEDKEGQKVGVKKCTSKIKIV